MQPILLGVNIDHVATVRQARGTNYPDPIYAALLAEEAGADGITLHLREDRRHIQDRDVLLMSQCLQTRMNFECAVLPEMIELALKVKPAHVCFVPEKREEITTEGGLDVVSGFKQISEITKKLQDNGIQVSLFIDPDPKQIDAAVKSTAEAIEIHTGAYADAKTPKEMQHELHRVQQAVEHASQSNLVINAGHGLHYQNVQAIARIAEINELNIGHAIVARAIMTGFKEAVSFMKQLMVQARNGHI